jgi:hypothetical protein
MTDPYEFSVVSRRSGHVMKFVATFHDQLASVEYQYLAPSAVRDGSIVLRSKSMWVLAVQIIDGFITFLHGIPWKEQGESPDWLVGEICRAISAHLKSVALDALDEVVKSEVGNGEG